MSLIERFYDPLAGHISVDGVDLRELNVHAWRQRIGLVSQEPVLFNASVLANIVFGAADEAMSEVKHEINCLPQCNVTLVTTA